MIYKHGLKKINEILAGIVELLEKYKLNSIDDFKGKVTFANHFDTELFLRTQFMERYAELNKRQKYLIDIII